MFPELGCSASRDQAYGQLVNAVLPVGLQGFFAAAMLGAIFELALRAKQHLHPVQSGSVSRMLAPQASEREAVLAGKVFGWAIAVFSMATAPLLMGQTSIFGYLQQMNGIYFVPILAVVLCAMLSPGWMPSLAAKVGLIAGPLLVASGYFVGPWSDRCWVNCMSIISGLVFFLLIVVMQLIQRPAPRDQPWACVEPAVVDMTPWLLARQRVLGCGIMVLSAYVSFFNFDRAVTRRRKDAVSAFSVSCAVAAGPDDPDPSILNAAPDKQLNRAPDSVNSDPAIARGNEPVPACRIFAQPLRHRCCSWCSHYVVRIGVAGRVPDRLDSRDLYLIGTEKRLIAGDILCTDNLTGDFKLRLGSGFCVVHGAKGVVDRADVGRAIIQSLLEVSTLTA